MKMTSSRKENEIQETKNEMYKNENGMNKNESGMNKTIILQKRPL